MLLFNKYFKESEPFYDFDRYEKGSSIERMALMLEFHNKIKDMGESPELVFSENGELYVKLGRTAYGPNDNEEVRNLGRFKVLSSKFIADKIKDKVTTKSSEDALFSIVRGIVDKALEVSIEKCRFSIDSTGSDLFEAKIIRAQSMGFDTGQVMFHETSELNKFSILSEGFNIDIVVARGSDNQVPNGVFMKPNSDSIGLHDNAVQLPFFLKKGNTKSFTDREDIAEYLCATSPEYLSLHSEKKEIDDHYDGEYVRLEKSLVRRLTNDESHIEIKAEIDQVLKDWGEKIEDNANKSRELITSILSERGYDYLEIKEDAGSFGRKVKTTVILNPDNIMSTSDNFAINIDSNYDVDRTIEV